MRAAAVAIGLAVGLCAGCATTGSACCGGMTGPKIRHVVFFKYKDTAAPAQVAEASAAFAALQHKIPGIVDFEMGTNCSPEPHSKGLTHAYVVTFANAAARDVYLPHPEHKAFVDILGPILDDVCVIDYELK